MENAQLIGLSRQLGLRRQLDVIANNLANINTAGFKGQNLLFEEYLMPKAEATAFQRPDHPLSYTNDYGDATNFAQGALRETGNPLDVAIQGDGFLVVQGPTEELYTRAGNFAVGPDGILQTQQGYPVLVDGGPIEINSEDGPLSIAKDGTLSNNQGILGRLNMVNFENPQELTLRGQNTYAGENPIPMENIEVQQGFLEMSNIEGVVEITRMIEVTRNYASVSRIISQRDDLQERAIRELGRVS
ncbi:flagellar basal-body rod protein FlgF [Pseudovibrio sp. SPO723]|uniref:flagellar basal-body rod protein FlgF n=1 Tax=Nesiotobacter zosterae TaxID=392721 RepID=UPI0029C24029|nr:flagellar basal-body rod protein FlgF [Pseudovibrio sp. SPO723]MDX5594154.1 flagellar basal-body rod protein FlgF [Pseudovibrio sp. SPO723]